MARREKEFGRGGAREATGGHIGTRMFTEDNRRKKTTPPTGPKRQQKQDLQRSKNAQYQINALIA